MINNGKSSYHGNSRRRDDTFERAVITSGDIASIIQTNSVRRRRIVRDFITLHNARSLYVMQYRCAKPDARSAVTLAVDRVGKSVYIIVVY
jgi:hypothetical protein